jgi:hypothetical protein
MGLSATDIDQDDQELKPAPKESPSEANNGGDWLSILLIAALLVVIFTSFSIKNLTAGVTAIVAPISLIILVIAAVRRMRPPDPARMERLRILERVLESDDESADPYLKRKALDAVISDDERARKSA